MQHHFNWLQCMSVGSYNSNERYNVSSDPKFLIFKLLQSIEYLNSKNRMYPACLKVSFAFPVKLCKTMHYQLQSPALHCNSYAFLLRRWFCSRGLRSSADSICQANSMIAGIFCDQYIICREATFGENKKMYFASLYSTYITTPIISLDDFSTSRRQITYTKVGNTCNFIKLQFQCSIGFFFCITLFHESFNK